MPVSEAQVTQRRRALGRKMAKMASDLTVMRATLVDTPDHQFLEPRELGALNRQVEGFAKLATNLETLGNKLEGK